MKQYLHLLEDVVYADFKHDRTGTGTLSMFGTQTRYDLSGDKLPLVTTKKMATKAIIHELLWFIAGDTNAKSLQRHGVRIWDEWADENGDLGPIYGKQWRAWNNGFSRRPTDQLAWVIEEIKTNPDSRRLIVNAWNVADLPDMALPPCPVMFQFYVNRGKLSCHMTQRSGDLFLGVPFDIAQYSLLTHMVAHVTGLEAHELIHSIGDAHLYVNHIDQAQRQVRREPLPGPTVRLNPDVNNIDNFEFGDIEIVGYRSHGRIPAPVAV